MAHLKTPLGGIINDLKGRAACYKQDWICGCHSGMSILAPTMYIFFASALPVIAFGEQLSKDTGRRSFPLDRYGCPRRCL
ncbi:boron transporter [Musa troglodytarum]|uniref:Boron transporter n=1 Tax=Musa troglodytarum TaxID=320322 RepID=A0A9E7EX92_9LILI|nr:boron transporter [Musa troglodytarum]